LKGFARGKINKFILDACLRKNSDENQGRRLAFLAKVCYNTADSIENPRALFNLIGYKTALSTTRKQAKI
jgi:hypothetical protein